MLFLVSYTTLDKKLACGDVGINPIIATKEHDISGRLEADKVLQKKIGIKVFLMIMV